MQKSPPLAWQGRVLFRVVAACLGITAACGGDPAPAEGDDPASDDSAALTSENPAGEGTHIMWLEVHEMLTRSLELSLAHKELNRAKALAVQALATAGTNPGLRAAAQLACALAEEARRDKKTALLHLRAAVDLLPANATSTDALVGAVLAAANVGGETAQNAREALDAWQARLEAARQPAALEAVALATTALDTPPARRPKHKLELVPEVKNDPPAALPTAGATDGLEYPVLVE